MREMKLPAKSERPLAPVTIDAGYQLNILLPHRNRAPWGWLKLFDQDDLPHGQGLSPRGLYVWVRSKRLGQLKYILERAKQTPWGQEIASHDLFRYFIQTAFYALTTEDNEEAPETGLPLLEAMGFTPTPELIEPQTSKAALGEMHRHELGRRHSLRAHGSKGARNGTINRELAWLKQMFRLAIDAGKLMTRPKIALLEENNA